jgi:REP element-mobilizing transposase RayT
VIARGLERKAIFRDDLDRQDLVDRLEDLTTTTGTEVFAWAILPNHFHLFVRTASAPLSDFMRSLNTGYAVRFNRRHRRFGYLFQNRFRSFLVEEEPYLLELVRYIHLNPLRAHLLSGVEELEGWPWAGHSALLGRLPRSWQAVQPILDRFGKTKRVAREAYRRFVAEGLMKGNEVDLAGGGLRRSRGVWQKCFGSIRGREKWAFDERVLGSGEFVERVLAGDRDGSRAEIATVSPAQALERLSEMLTAAAQQYRVTPREIAGSSHRPAAVAARTAVCREAVLELGFSSNAVARFLGITRQSVRRALERVDQAPHQCEDSAREVCSLNTGVARR